MLFRSNHVAIEERIKRVRRKTLRRLTKYSLGKDTVQEVFKSEFDITDRDLVPEGGELPKEEIELEDEIFVIEDCDRFNNNNRYSENKKLNDDIRKMNDQTAEITRSVIVEEDDGTEGVGEKK